PARAPARAPAGPCPSRAQANARAVGQRRPAGGRSVDSAVPPPYIPAFSAKSASRSRPGRSVIMRRSTLVLALIATTAVSGCSLRAGRSSPPPRAQQTAGQAGGQARSQDGLRPFAELTRGATARTGFFDTY